MTTPNFKQGQWLISRWKKEEGGATVFCRFLRHSKWNRFETDKFYRIEDKDIVPVDINKVYYFSDGKSLQWRPATQAELKKYSSLIFR